MACQIWQYGCSLIVRLGELEAEDARLKKMYAEERLKAEIIQEAISKKVVKPSCCRQIAQQAIIDHAVSIRLVCKVFSISETCYRYQAKLSDDNALIT